MNKSSFIPQRLPSHIHAYILNTDGDLTRIADAISIDPSEYDSPSQHWCN